MLPPVLFHIDHISYFNSKLYIFACLLPCVAWVLKVCLGHLVPSKIPHRVFGFQFFDLQSTGKMY